MQFWWFGGVCARIDPANGSWAQTLLGVCMQASAEHKRAAKARAKPETQADKELALMKAYVKKITSSPEDSRALLQRAGILDKKGELAKPYRN